MKEKCGIFRANPFNTLGLSIMKKYFSLVVFFITVLVAPSVHAQEATQISKLLDDKNDISIHDINNVNKQVVVSDTLDGWKLSWFGNLNGSQAAYNNWSSGGVNTVSITASTVYKAMYRKEKFAYALDANLEYGKARIEGEGTRKTNDRIAVNNKFSYLFSNDDWSAFGNINFATQIDRGFNYNVDDEEDPVLISSFLAPAYFTQIAGISYSPADFYSAEAGLAMKETIVNDTTLSTRYGLEPGQKFRVEPGYAVAMNFQKTIFENVRLSSSIETFTNLRESVKGTDVYFQSEVVGKINSFMNMSFGFTLAYDEDFSDRVQVKQVLSAGVSIDIL